MCRKIQISLKSDKNNEYFAWRPEYIYDSISLNSSSYEKCVRQNWLRKSKHIFYVQQRFFLPENRAVYKIMWKSIVDREKPQMTIQYGACALHAGWLIQERMHTVRIFNCYWFSTANMVTRTGLNVILRVIRTLPVLSLLRRYTTETIPVLASGNPLCHLI